MKDDASVCHEWWFASMVGISTNLFALLFDLDMCIVAVNSCLVLFLSKWAGGPCLLPTLF